MPGNTTSSSKVSRMYASKPSQATESRLPPMPHTKAYVKIMSMAVWISSRPLLMSSLRPGATRASNSRETEITRLMSTVGSSSLPFRRTKSSAGSMYLSKRE